jgi:hypothetical protein
MMVSHDHKDQVWMRAEVYKVKRRKMYSIITFSG